MKSDTRTYKSLFLLILSMIIFGTIGIFRRSIALPSEVLAFARGIMGSVFLILYRRIRGGKIVLSAVSGKNLILLVITGGLIGFNWILLFEAYNYTSVAVATLCYYMQPVIVLLVSPVLLKERLTARKSICIGLAFLGMILVSGILGGVQTGSGQITGVLCGLGAAVLYASVVLLNKKITGVPVIEKTIIQLFSAAVCLLPYLLLRGTLTAYTLDSFGIVMLLITGIVHTGIAYVLYFGAVENLPAQTSALFSYIDPVTAVLLSALLLHEPMGVPGIIGTVLIIGAAIASE